MSPVFVLLIASKGQSCNNQAAGDLIGNPGNPPPGPSQPIRIKLEIAGRSGLRYRFWVIRHQASSVRVGARTSEGIGKKVWHNAKDAHLNNLSQHEIKMGIFFVFRARTSGLGREKSGDGGARGGVPRRRHVLKALPRINGCWAFS